MPKYDWFESTNSFPLVYSLLKIGRDKSELTCLKYKRFWCESLSSTTSLTELESTSLSIVAHVVDY